MMKTRWLIALCAVLMQTMLGTAYAWSVFKTPLQELHHWSGSQLSVAFALMIFFLGVSAAFGGKFVDKAGVKTVASVGSILFGAGTLIAGYATAIGHLPLLWFGYGVVAGIGNGLGYITPVATLVRWFPDKRGLITGIAVMGFGFGGAFIAVLAPLLIADFGIVTTFYILGLIYLLVMLSCAQTFSNPPADWMKEYQPTQKAARINFNITLQHALKMPQFYILWSVFLVNITAGVALLSNLSPLSQSHYGLTAAQAGSLVFLTSIFNGLGRVFWSTLSDKLGRKITFMVIIYSQIPFLFLLPVVNNVYIFAAMSCYIVACMGGGFATMPAFVADIFGVKNMGNIYGKFLLAWSTAGVLGPLLTEYAKQHFGEYTVAFYGLGLVFVCIYVPLSYFLKPIEVTPLRTPIKPKKTPLKLASLTPSKKKLNLFKLKEFLSPITWNLTSN